MLEANELLEYWSEHPPAHVLLAAIMRAQPLRKSYPSYTAIGEVSTRKRELTSAVIGAGGRASSAPSPQMKTLLDSD